MFSVTLALIGQAQIQDIRVRPLLGLYLCQFLVGFDVVAQFDPALRGQKVKTIGWLQGWNHGYRKLSHEDSMLEAYSGRSD